MKNSLYLGLALATASCTEPQTPHLGKSPCVTHVNAIKGLANDTTYPGHYPHTETQAISEDIANRLLTVSTSNERFFRKCKPTEIAEFVVTTRIFGAYDWSLLPTNGPVRADSWIHLFGPDKDCFYNNDPVVFDYPNGDAFVDTVVARFEEALDCAGY
jgi:hypothetical protein